MSPSLWILPSIVLNVCVKLLVSFLFCFLRLEAEAKYSAFDSVLFYACASGSPLDTKTNMSGA